MAIRFRKSLKLAPGVRMNLSGSGVSWSLGPRGASIGIGKRGTFLNAGVPGTGLSMRSALTGGSQSSGSRRHSVVQSSGSPQLTSVSLTVHVDDEGAITFKDGNGNSVSEEIVEAAKAQKGPEIRAMVQRECDRINGQVEALGSLHLDTPSPTSFPTYTNQSFHVPPPTEPVDQVPGFFEKFFSNKVARIQELNEKARDAYEEALRSWGEEKSAFNAVEAQKQELLTRTLAGSPDAMEEFFGRVLEDITWPRETLVSFEVRESGSALVFDVDLPEIEDMPNKTASVPQRGLRLSIKEIGPTNIQKMYAQHVHSIGFRLIGEAFAMLPSVHKVTLSGYSQRRSKVTGQEVAEYLYSVTVPREKWLQIDFSGLHQIEVAESFTQFELRRKMSKTGIFKEVEPF